MKFWGNSSEKCEKNVFSGMSIMTSWEGHLAHVFIHICGTQDSALQYVVVAAHLKWIIPPPELFSFWCLPVICSRNLVWVRDTFHHFMIWFLIATRCKILAMFVMEILKYLILLFHPNTTLAADFHLCVSQGDPVNNSESASVKKNVWWHSELEISLHRLNKFSLC